MLLLVLLSVSIWSCVSLEKTYGVSDVNIPKIDKTAAIEAIENDPHLGAEMVDGFLQEAFSSWDIMKRKHWSFLELDTVERDFGTYLAISLNRYMEAAKLLPSPHLETRALSALASRESNAKERNAKRKKKMLCTVFLNGYEPDFDILHGNLNATQGTTNGPHCEWLIIFFGGDDKLISKFYSETGTGIDNLDGHASIGIQDSSSDGKAKGSNTTQTSSTYNHIVAAFDYMGPRAVSGTDFTPKQMWYPLVVPYLEQYQRVWLLDADISIQHFDFDFLHKTFDCAGWGDGNQVHDGVDAALPRGPIISQPLVLEDTQYYSELNYGSYHREARKARGRRSRQGSLAKHRHLLAYRTKLVEQQAPIFHADFFEWYAISLVKPWLPVMLTMESTWGFDTTWCGAAEQYITYKRSSAVGGSGGSGSGSSCYGCAVLIQGSPISHLQSSRKSGMKANKYGSPLAVAVFYMTGHLTKAWVHDRHRAWSEYHKKGNGLGRPTKLTGIPHTSVRAGDAMCSSREQKGGEDREGKSDYYQAYAERVEAALNRSTAQLPGATPGRGGRTHAHAASPRRKRRSGGKLD